MSRYLEALGILCAILLACAVTMLGIFLAAWFIEEHIYWGVGIVIVGLLAIMYWRILMEMED